MPRLHCAPLKGLSGSNLLERGLGWLNQTRLDLSLSNRKNLKQGHGFLRFFVAHHILEDGLGLTVLSDDKCLPAFPYPPSPVSSIDDDIFLMLNRNMEIHTPMLRSIHSSHSW